MRGYWRLKEDVLDSIFSRTSWEGGNRCDNGMNECKYIIQGVSGGIVNILGRGSMEYSE